MIKAETLTAVTVVFIVLKLTHVINWSWWWVFSPWLIPIGLIAAVFALVIVIALIAKLFD